jgi:hypothetical protein
MGTVMAWATLVLLVIGLGLCVTSHRMLAAEMKKKGEQAYKDWKESDLRELGARKVLTLTIWFVIAVIGITIVLYLLGEPQQEKAGLGAALDYLPFAGPCLGALVVGLGILEAKKDAQQPMIEVDFRYFAYGIPFLLAGYVAYIFHNYNHVVHWVVWSMTVAACFIPFIARKAWGFPEVIPSDRVGTAGLVSIAIAGGCLLIALLIAKFA